MSGILRIGSSFRTDERGRFRNDASMAGLPGKWAEALEAVQRACVERFADDLVSLYVRGSVAKGEPIDLVSDIDVAAVLRGEPRVGAFSHDLSQQIRAAFPFTTGAELAILTREQLFEPESPEALFLLKTSGVLLHGSDVLAEVPAFEPGRALAFGLHGGIATALRNGARSIREGDTEHTRQACAWTMKRLLRTGAALVMEEEKTYARDLYPAFRLFARNYPAQENEMRNALHWAVDPTSDADALLEYLDGFGSWLVAEVDRKLRR